MRGYICNFVNIETIVLRALGAADVVCLCTGKTRYLRLNCFSIFAYYATAKKNSGSFYDA